MAMEVLSRTTGRRGIPATVTVRAMEFDEAQIEGTAKRTEDEAFAGSVLVLGQHIHRLVPRLDRGPVESVIEQKAGELIYLAERRLRQLGGNDAA